MTPDFSCERCQDSLPWYTADSLSNDERAAMERHLATCGRCRAALDEWREVAAALHRADERIPLDTASISTWANISSQLQKQIQLPYNADERTTMSQQDSSLPPAAAPTGESPVARPHRRIPAFVSLVAAAAVIALSIGIFSLFAGHGTARNTGHGGTNTATIHPTCSPSQVTASLPAHAILTAIAPVGADDGWAVGGASDPKDPASPPSTVILRLQNCHWTPVGTPISKATLHDISMVSADEGWAVGSKLTLDTTPLSNGQPRNSWEASAPLVLHYTHGSWQQVDVAADTSASAEKVKLVSADEGWMLLYGGKHSVSSNINQPVGYQYSLLHYQNGTWTDVPMTFRKPQMALSDLDARQSGDVWVVGFDNSSGATQALAAHYSRGAWTSYTGATIVADPQVLASGTDLTSVSVLSPTDVWAAGAGIYHFDGTRWTQASVQGKRSGVTVLGDIHPSIGKIAMASPTEGWSFLGMGDVGMNNPNATQEQALHFENGVWTWTNLQLQGVKLPMPVVDAALSSPKQGWAISQDMPNPTEQTSVLLYYDAGIWSVVRQQS